MPKTRSGAAPVLTSRENGQMRANSKNDSIIYISSDSDEFPTPAPKTRRTTSKTSKRRTADTVSAAGGSSSSFVHAREVEVLKAEIARLDAANSQLRNAQDSSAVLRIPPAPPSSSPSDASTKELRDLKRKHKTLKDDLEKARKENARLQTEAADLRVAAKASKATAVDPQLLDELDEHLSCRVCSETMWYPYTLSACGHTFCQNCLFNWFLDTYRKHHSPPERKYQCPECRTPVTLAPAEQFVLKDVAASIGAARKQTAPDRWGQTDREIRAIVDAGHGCWDAFFPSTQPRRIPF